MESNNKIDPPRDQQADSQNAEQAETTKTPDTPDTSENASAPIVENNGETTVGANAGISSNVTKELPEVGGTDMGSKDDLKNMGDEHMSKSASIKETNESSHDKKTVGTGQPTDVGESVSAISDDYKSSISSTAANLLRFSLSKQIKETTDEKTSAIEETPADEKKVDHRKAEETDKTSGKKMDAPSVGEPSNNGKDAPSKSAYLKLDRKCSLHDESIGSPTSNLRASSGGPFYLQVRGMLEIVNMDELRTQLSNDIGDGVKKARPSIIPKTSREDATKPRSTSVPAKAVSKYAPSKDSSTKRLVKKPEDLSKTSGSMRASISSKKAQIPPIPSLTRQQPKKPQESNIQAKGKENGPATIATRFLGPQKTPTSEEKNVPTFKEKMKSTFVPTKKESLKNLPTKLAPPAKERIVGKVPPQSLAKSLPPKDLLTKIKNPLPAKAMPKQVKSLHKNPPEQKEKEAGDAKDSQKETARRVSLTPSARNSSKPNASTSARRSSVRAKTNATVALTKKENTKQMSSVRSNPKRVSSHSAKTPLAKLAGALKAKEKKKPLEKEKETDEKKIKSTMPSFKKLETTEKVPEKLSKEESQPQVAEADTQEKKDVEEKKEEEKEVEQKEGEENKVQPDEVKEEDKSEKTTNEQQEIPPEGRIVTDEPKEDQEKEKLEQQPHTQVEGKEEVKPEVKPEVETEEKPEEKLEEKPEEKTEEKQEEKTLKEDDAKTEKNEEEPVVGTEEKGEQTEKNEIISEQKVEEKQVTPQDDAKGANIKEAEVKKEGKIETSRTTERKKEERKKGDAKKSVDLKSTRKVNMKPEIASLKTPESKLKMGLKLKGLHKSGNTTVPSTRSDGNVMLKEKKELKKTAGKDMEKASMFTSLTLKKGLHPKKSNDLKKTGVVKSETKDTNTEKKKSDLASEKTSMKISIKGSMKVAVKEIAKGVNKTPVKTASKSPITTASKTVSATAAKTPTSAKTPLAKTPLAKTPLAKTPLAKTPLAKTPLAKTPLAKTPLAKTPLAKTPLAKTPSAKHPSAKHPSVATSKAQSAALAKESEKATEIDKTSETEKIYEAEKADVIKEETLEAEKARDIGETLEREEFMGTGITPEMETSFKMESLVDPSRETQIEDTQGEKVETDEKDAAAPLQSLGSSKMTLHSLISLNSKGKSVKPLNLKKLGSSKVKKTSGKRNVAELSKSEDQAESNVQATSGNIEKENSADMGTERETENKVKESNVSPSSKRSLKSKKSSSSKYMGRSMTNTSLLKKISSLSNTKNKNPSIKKKMGSGLKGSSRKAKNATTSKADNFLKKQKSKIRRDIENYEHGESTGKTVLRRSQTKKEFLKSGTGTGTGSLRSLTKGDMKLRKFKTEYFNKKSMKKYLKQKGKKKSKKESTTVSDSDEELSTRMTGPALSGADSPNLLHNSLTTEKVSMGTSKMGSNKAHSPALKKSTLKKQKSSKLAQLTSNEARFLSHDAASLASTHGASAKSKKTNKKPKAANLWNETLEEEMDRIIQDNTILLDEQTDQKMRQMLLENEQKLIKCKNAITDADLSRNATSPNKITPSKFKSRAESMKRISEHPNMQHFPRGAPVHDYRSASVGNVMRNASVTLNKKPFTNVFNSNIERYTCEPSIRPGIKVAPGKLQEPSSKTTKWLFNNCCYKNTAQNDINITNGRNEPMLRDFSSLLNEQNKYIPVVYGSQQVFNPNVNTLNDPLKKSNIYNSNMITKKMQYYSNNVPNVNATEVTLPINYRNTHHSFSLKIKKFPDTVPTRSSFCNCV